MQRTKLLPVKDLSIDLNNFRTIAQKTELDAIKAMISISPDYFWGLMESLLDDGYLPTENIIVLEGGDGKHLVKEGNRRVASVKIMLGLIDKEELDLPPKITERIAKLDNEWANTNSSVPCAIFEASEETIVDRIVTHTHGKGQKAGRDSWEAVARARHNKIINRASEPSLDLLEKYLIHGGNLTQDQKVRWAGRYNLSVLDEAIKKTAPRLGASSSPELVKLYPKIVQKKQLDNIIHAIGMETLTFPVIRDSSDFLLRFGIGPIPTKDDIHSESTRSANTLTEGNRGTPDASTVETLVLNSTPSQTSTLTTTSTVARRSATATTDERTVKKALRALKVYGQSRTKVETLRQEMIKLNLKHNPIAFCFLLRSMFEISAKAYCKDHSPTGPTPTKPDGNDRSLADVLREIVNHLTQNQTDREMVKLLHGPLTEIQRKDGILSVTSMNQLVHNPAFTILPSDIPTLFTNIFPLLEHMNK